MARYSNSISITFNDNDGGVGWRVCPNTAKDIARYINTFGKYKARWIFFKRFWRAMMWMEDYSKKYQDKNVKLWVFKPEIEE